MPQNLRCFARAGLLVAALLLTTALTTACVDAGGQQVTVKALDTMRFEPATVTVPAGKPVQVTLANDGVLIHDIVLSDGVDQPVKIETIGKASASGTFTIAQPGTYTYVCAQPGHEAAGMKGTIVAR